MSKVSVAEGRTSSQAIRGALEDVGLDFIDVVKNAKTICIVSTALPEATQTVIDTILFHCRAQIHVLTDADEAYTVEASIARGDGVRMPIRRPKAIMDADVLISLAPMFPDSNRRTACSIEQFLFHTWYVPPRKTALGFICTHEPWLEGELRDVVLADLYVQKPVTFAIIDGSQTVGLALAGFDAVAVDSVAVKMNNVDPEDVGYLRILNDQGLGTCVLSKIDIPLGLISR